MYGPGSTLFEEQFLAGLSEMAELAGDTAKQAAYRACIQKQRAGARINCQKPAKKAQAICKEEGGTWANKQCSFPSGAVTGTGPTAVTQAVDSDTKKQAAYRECLLKQKAGLQIACTKPARKAQQICTDVGGHWANRQCSFAPVVVTGTVDTDTKKQAAYRECLLKQKAGLQIACTKPARKAQQICTDVGGHWANRQCSFAPVVVTPTPTPVVVQPTGTVDTDTKKQAAYRACLLQQKQGLKIACKKPARKAKDICADVGGTWSKRQCTFPVALPTPTPAPTPTPTPTPQPGPDPIVGPAPCGSGYVARNGDCVPAQACPSGYTLQRYGTTRYFQCVYQQPSVDDTDTLPDGGGDLYPDNGGDDLPADYTPTLYPYGSTDGAVWSDWSYTPSTPSTALMPSDVVGTEFETYDEGLPAAMSMVAGMAECDPSFSQYLPMDYEDNYGTMTVQAVFCATPSGTGGSVLDPQAQEPIEYAEMETMAGMGRILPRRLG